MLRVIGVKKIDDLFADIKPEHKPQSFDLPAGKSEYDVIRQIRELAQRNTSGRTLFIGGGYYDHYIPAAVDALISRGEFFTAYTPYQPECSQGTLQALYEYQSSICTLTGMEAANASLYDGGTALWEAMMMAIRMTGRRRIVVDEGVSPIFRKILKSYTAHLDIELQEIPIAPYATDRGKMIPQLDERTAAVIFQNPNFLGTVDDYSDIVEQAHKHGVLTIASVYPISLGILKTPAEMGVDIATGEGQSLGLPLNFGGPYLGFMTTRQEYIRKMPGRIVGQTVDDQGRRCFVNTLQAREQHIRREKATSNICTNVSLCALRALVYLSLIGKQGFRRLAQLNLEKAEFARRTVAEIPGIKVDQRQPIFNEFVVRLPRDASLVVKAMIDKGFAAGFPLGRYYEGRDEEMIIAVTEKRTREEIAQFAEALKEILKGRA